jgi:hypothetical protein
MLVCVMVGEVPVCCCVCVSMYMLVCEVVGGVPVCCGVCVSIC